MSLYNLRSSDGAWRITKFTSDLEVESSYITSEDSCDCPAGQRPTCRHRQMLPVMLAQGIEDSPGFYDFDKNVFLEPVESTFEEDDDGDIPGTGEDENYGEAVPTSNTDIPSTKYRYDEDNCPGHVASYSDPKICGKCGTHIDSLRPEPTFDQIVLDESGTISQSAWDSLKPHGETVITSDFESESLGSTPSEAANPAGPHPQLAMNVEHPSIGHIKRRI